jgi:hypothetical protein
VEAAEAIGDPRRADRSATIDLGDPQQIGAFTVFIKFDDRQDEARGIDELSRTGRVYGYKGGIWAVRQECVALLDDLKIIYRPATEAEIDAALGSVRHPPAAVLAGSPFSALS